MYNDEQNLYHYTYRKDGTEPGQRYDAKQPGVDEQLNNYRQQICRKENGDTGILSGSGICRQTVCAD